MLAASKEHLVEAYIKLWRISKISIFESLCYTHFREKTATSPFLVLFLR